MKFMYQFYFIAIKESVAWLLFKVVLQHPLLNINLLSIAYLLSMDSSSFLRESLIPPGISKSIFDTILPVNFPLITA